MKLLQVSVIICACTEKRWDALVRAVASAASQELRTEVIVVIDHNPALLARAEAALTEARVVPNRHARGASGARNSGVEIARGEIVAFLDDDACAAPDWLDRLCAPYADARIVGVGGSIAPRWPVKRPCWFPEEFDWVVGCTYRGFRVSSGPVRNLIGANMSFRRSAINAVSGFREDLGPVGTGMLRCEETEFCIRLGAAMPDRIIAYEPRAQVVHQVTPERTRWSYFCRRCFTEGEAKAQVVRLVGTRCGLASERAYALKALPVAVLRDIRAACSAHDVRNLARAGAVIAGFALTTAGYLIGSLAGRVTARAAGGAEPPASVAASMHELSDPPAS